MEYKFVILPFVPFLACLGAFAIDFIFLESN